MRLSILPDDRQDFYDTKLDELEERRKAARKDGDEALEDQITATIRKTRDQRATEKKRLRRERREAGQAWDQKVGGWLMKGVVKDRFDAFLDTELALLQRSAIGLIREPNAEAIEAFVEEHTDGILRRAKPEADHWFDATKLPWPKSLVWLGPVVEVFDDFVIDGVIDGLRPQVKKAVAGIFDKE